MSFLEVNDIKASLVSKEVSLSQAKAAQSYYMEHYGYQIAQLEQDIYELNIRLQLAEAQDVPVRPLIHPAHLELMELCEKPLQATSDAARLEELEGRFPAKMILTVDEREFEIKSSNDHEMNMFRIFSITTSEMWRNFADFGVCKGTKPELTVKWKGLRLDVDNLF